MAYKKQNSNLNKFELLKKGFLNSLSPERYGLLEELANHSKCITDFIFRHTGELEYIYENLEKPLLKRENLINEALKLLDIKSDKEFVEKLTYFKLKHFSRIVAKDIYKKERFEDLLAEYSYLADATLEVAYRRAYKKFEKKYGTPLDEFTGERAKGSVIALGKLGGLELNYYSDIDIMYIYSNEGKTTQGLTNREFFISVFRQLTTYLTKRNIEGITWIIDLDLRPEGKKGLLAYSLPSVEFYYWTHGRTWERQMLIKARHSAGEEEVSKEFLKIVKPFSYRKYTSGDILNELKGIKRLIEDEAKRKIQNGVDLKKSRGGIREVEFSVQILQLLYGGKDTELQDNRTLGALSKLIKKGYILEDDGKILKNGYIFLRKLEHLVQLENCIQTQTFKFDKADSFAEKLGFNSGEELIKKLKYYMEGIDKIFSSITPDKNGKLTPIQKFILTKHYEDKALEHLKKLGFKDTKWALERFKEIYFSKAYIQLSENFKENLFRYIPELERELAGFPDKRDFLLNLTKLLIDGGMLIILASALEQNENLVEFMLNIAKSTDYISNLMSKDRELLDWVFGLEDVPVSKQDFEKHLNVFLENNPFLSSLRKLKNYVEVSNALRYLAYIDRENPYDRLKNLNNALSNLADFILENLYKYYNGKDFIVYALGKLGSREMNIGSDLDLIFIFKDEFSKFNYRRIPIQITKELTKYTKDGTFYQIDLRLRPFGKGGELSPSLKFYKNYFLKEARDWERLAWTKARYILGNREIKADFENLLQNFLFDKPINKTFIENILNMRLKLEGLTKESSMEIDIKLGKGGLADFEFLAQLKILKEKIRKTNIREVIKDYFPDLLEDYLFLREVEGRLRMIKGVGISRLSINSPYFYRLAHSFKLSEKELWDRIKDTKNRTRDKFLKLMVD